MASHRFSFLLALLLLTFNLTAAMGQEATLQWHDLRGLGIEGKGWTETKQFYDRLPAKAEGVVRDPVWELAGNSAGLSVRFLTDSDSISVRWRLRESGLALPHMPATGVSGVDLYVKDEGQWRWLAVGRPTQFPVNEQQLVRGLPEGLHEYQLYLPLYNGVESVEIGLAEGAVFRPAQAYEPDRSRPIVFYGTSIVQGGVASRPGMAYPAILGRRLEVPTINLGFSGNGRMEPEMASLVAEIDAAVFVIDCLPNVNGPDLGELTEHLVHTIRRAHPVTPIVLVENIHYQGSEFLESRRRSYEQKNEAYQAAYENLIAAGVKHLYYFRSDTLLGADGEATVDGSHPTDLGFMRMADALEPLLRRVL